MKRAAALLAEGRLTVQAVAYQVGISLYCIRSFFTVISN